MILTEGDIKDLKYGLELVAVEDITESPNLGNTVL